MRWFLAHITEGGAMTWAWPLREQLELCNQWEVEVIQPSRFTICIRVDAPGYDLSELFSGDSGFVLLNSTALDASHSQKLWQSPEI